MNSITIKLDLPEIIYDIQNKTYLTGRSAENNSNHSHVANMQANDDDENSAQILRSLTTGLAILRNRLAEYLDSADASADNGSLTADDELTLTLAMPSNYNRSATSAIAESAHHFLVAYAVADWFAITAKDETADYSAVSEQALKILEESICKRSRPKRHG